MSKGVFIVSAKRTPFGAFGGKFLKSSATTMGVYSSKAAIASANVDPNVIDTVVFGNVAQTSDDAIYISRHIALRSGIPIPTPALTVNRLCGSGFQAVVSAAQEILLGEASVALVGGSESMSQAPYTLRNVRFGNPKFGENLKLEDSLWQALTDSFCNTPMALTAENLAEKYQITRQACDEFALKSQQNWAKADQAGVFKAEIAPVELPGKKGAVDLFEKDEHPRPNSTIESLAKLPPVFKKDGVVTAGNASGICDGAASLIIAGEDALKTHKLTPKARIVSWASAGVEPSIMGIGPAPAVRLALKRAGLSLKDMGLIEVNEAFAAQTLAVAKELDLDASKLNTSGGAIALGHPLGASGARIVGHLTHAFERNPNVRYALGTACIGGGQGIAVILERV